MFLEIGIVTHGRGGGTEEWKILFDTLPSISYHSYKTLGVHSFQLRIPRMSFFADAVAVAFRHFFFFSNFSVKAS